MSLHPRAIQPLPPAAERTKYEFQPLEQPLFRTSGTTFPLGAEYHPPGHRGRDQIEHLRTHGNFLIARTTIFARETLRALGHLVGAVRYSIGVVVFTLVALTCFYLAAAIGLAPSFDAKLKRAAPFIDVKTGQWTTVAPGPPVCGVDTNPTCRAAGVTEVLHYRAGLIREAALDIAKIPAPFWRTAGVGLTFAVALFLVTLLLAPHRPRAASDGESPEDAFERKSLVKMPWPLARSRASSWSSSATSVSRPSTPA